MSTQQRFSLVIHKHQRRGPRVPMRLLRAKLSRDGQKRGVGNIFVLETAKNSLLETGVIKLIY